MQDDREKATQVVSNGFLAVARIYRHAYQIITLTAEELVSRHGLFMSDGLFTNSHAITAPNSWLYNYCGKYLAREKIDLDKYKENSEPVLFLQVSLNDHKAQEPLFRYGIIKKMINIRELKRAKFEEYFSKLIREIHSDRTKGSMEKYHFNAVVDFDEKKLLDIREDAQIEALVNEIETKYIALLQEPK